MTRLKPLSAATMLCLLGVAASVQAENFCVATSAELDTALAAAEVADEDSVIRLRTGVYSAPATGWAVDLGSGEHSLDIVGGYQDETCSARTADAEATVLDGEDRVRILSVDVSCNFVAGTVEHVRVTGITFERGFDTEVSALKISDLGPISCGQIAVEGNIFRRNRATIGSFSSAAPALLAATDGLDFNGGIWLVVRNNLFDGNVGPNAPAAFLFSNNRVVFDGNTVVGNSATGENVDQRTILETFSGATTLANNIFWSNNTDGTDIFDVRTNEATDLLSNTIQVRIGPAASDTGSSATDPSFVDPVAGDFRLNATSPAIDTGTVLAAIPASDFDVAGTARVVGTDLDRGAYEFTISAPDPIFADGFED